MPGNNSMSLARIQGKEQSGYPTKEEPFNTGGKEVILLKIHEDDAR